MKLNRTFAVMLTLLLTISWQSAFAQGTRGGEKKTINAADGWPLKITYYASPGDKESPVVILIPGAEGLNSMPRRIWERFALQLQRDKFAVVTVDLRKHGDSVPPGSDDTEDPKALRLLPTDYTAMAALDLEAVKNFLLVEHENQKLNIRKLGIVSAGSSSVVASVFAATDWSKKPWNDARLLALKTPRGQDVQAMIMLSPKSSVRGLNPLPALKFISDPTKGIAVQIYHNAEDRTDKIAAEKVFKLLDLKGKEPEGARKLTAVKNARGATGEKFLELTNGPEMEKLMKEFLVKFVQERQSPWKTRKSKLVQ